MYALHINEATATQSCIRYNLVYVQCKNNFDLFTGRSTANTQQPFCCCFSFTKVVFLYSMQPNATAVCYNINNNKQKQLLNTPNPLARLSSDEHDNEGYTYIRTYIQYICVNSFIEKKINNNTRNWV